MFKQSMCYKDGNTYRILYDNTADNYLQENHVIRYGKLYYQYVPNKGIWIEKALDDIQIDVARFYENNTFDRWSVRYKKEMLEKLRIKIQETDRMDVSDSAVCLQNGVFNMETEVFGDFSEEYYFTKSLPVFYDENADCPKFKKFLKQASCGNLQRQQTLEEFLGLALTKNVGPAKALVCKGTGANGKSVYCEILCDLLGNDNWTTISLKDLPNFGSAKVKGKRLAIMTEISRETSKALMTNELKQLITGDRMSCNKKYSDIEDMKPFAKVLILTNHSVGFTEDDTDGALRRLLFVPFDYQVKKMDTKLEDKLRAEISGIFNLAIEGYSRLKSNDFVYSSNVESENIKKTLLLSENPLRCFIKENIEFSHGSNIAYSDFKEYYRAWCDENEVEADVQALDSKLIYSEVSKRFNGVEKRSSHGKRGIKHIKIKE